MAHFQIEDEGSGIEVIKEKLNLIFERFYRVDDSRSKQIKGFGLGLSIVQQIVDVHDGHIHVSNKKAKRTFYRSHAPASALKAVQPLSRQTRRKGRISIRLYNCPL